MTAIPVNNKGEEPVVSDIFAMSKWFAIVDAETVSFEKNIYKNGSDVIEWLNSLGVNQIVTNKIGSSAFEMLNQFNITCFYSDLKVRLIDIIAQAKEEKLKILDTESCVFEKKCG